MLGDEKEDAPRKGIPYTLDITTKSGGPVPQKKGKTDNNGFLDETIPPDASVGIIVLDEGEDEQVHEGMLGHLDPIDTISGVQARLNNLDYNCGDEDGILGVMTRNAIRNFQADNDLEILTGDFDFTDIDQDTLDKIEELSSGEE
jgi:N-acetylmuramoyl-L-alanine amidase